mgnify:CR=1 FL=1
MRNTKLDRLKFARIDKADKTALEEFKKRVSKEFPYAKFILFGSKAKNSADKFSDIDVLVILKKVTTKIEEKIFEIGFEIGLKQDVVFGIVVEEERFLNSSLAKTMPFYKNVYREGIEI